MSRSHQRLLTAAQDPGQLPPLPGLQPGGANPLSAPASPPTSPALPPASRFEPVEVAPPVLPDPYLTQPLLPFWAWCAIAITLLAVTIVAAILAKRLCQRKAASPISAPSPLETALAKVSALPLESASLREVATTCSLALREFLQSEFHDPALYMTHEEFIQSSSTLSRIPDSLSIQTRKLLQELAHLKYAPQMSNPEEAVQLTSRTRDLLTAIARANREAIPGNPAA